MCIIPLSTTLKLYKQLYGWMLAGLHGALIINNHFELYITTGIKQVDVLHYYIIYMVK